MKKLTFFLVLIFLGATALSSAQAPEPVSELAPLSAPAPAAPSPVIDSVAQEIRQEVRQQELAAGGFKWLPWSQAGDKVLKFISDRDPRFAEQIKTDKNVDFAIADVDNDGYPDTIITFWGDCTSRGCPYNIYFEQKEKPAVYYFSHTIKSYQKGVLLDDKGYSPF